MIVQTVLVKLGNWCVPAADRKPGIGIYEWQGVVFNSRTVPFIQLPIMIAILSYSSVSELKLIPLDTTRFYCTNKNKNNTQLKSNRERRKVTQHSRNTCPENRHSGPPGSQGPSPNTRGWPSELCERWFLPETPHTIVLTLLLQRSHDLRKPPKQTVYPHTLYNI